MRNLQIPTRMAALLCLVFIFHSCSKDADLLSEYVITKSDNATNLQTYVVNDVFYIDSNTHIVLDVLNNDNFEELSNVSITNTSSAQNGTIVINSDNTLTYTPKEEVTVTEEFEDTFTYTAEEVDEEGTVTEEEATVTVSNDESLDNHESQRTNTPISDKVLKWKALFDNQTEEDQRQIALSLSGDGGDLYYLDVSPYVYMFQATNEDTYMDFAVNLFQNVISTANDGKIKNDGFLGWIDSTIGITTGVAVNNGTEVSLAEGRGMRTVARMLWVLSKSSRYLNKGNNRQHYNEMLDWFQEHVWNKWYSRGLNNLYRSRTHMSSHWGQIAWFLHGITGEEKYREIYLGWSSGIHTGEFVGMSMRGQLRDIDISGKKGYIWNSSWGIKTGVNDVSHANAEVELMILGAEMNDYWTLDDMNALITTFDNLIFVSNDWDNSSTYIDGSGKEAALWDQGWVQLGRFSEELQNKLENADILPTYYYYQKVRIANLAYNQAYLEQNLFYPE
ncbi:MAG: Ig-like domain-containing protein [Maribacter dokdonensis]|uniref:Ig-like domain-containing protein n=4 Tax=Maribacter dokdonensis TaxID=320912 RepID=UPI003265E47C